MSLPAAASPPHAADGTFAHMTPRRKLSLEPGGVSVRGARGSRWTGRGSDAAADASVRPAPGCGARSPQEGGVRLPGDR